LEYAIKRNNEKYDPDKATQHNDVKVNRSLFTKTIMALMSKQEMSHQQIMSYLIGGGDCYASHTFKVVKWGDFDRHIAKAEKATIPEGNVVLPIATYLPVTDEPLHFRDDEMSQDSPVHGTDETRGDDEIEEEELEARHAFNVEQLTIIVQDNFVGIASNIQDYPHRSIDPVFEELNLWDHEEQVVKISKANEEKHLARVESKAEDAELHCLLGDEDAPDELVGHGREAEARGEYTDDHDQVSTHLSRFRAVPVINVLLGDKLPRPDRGTAERDKWSQAMMILFKPWHELSDLKGGGESWTVAFKRTQFNHGALDIMNNINVENECKDAKDKYEVLRKAGKVKALIPSHNGLSTGTDIESLTNALVRNPELDTEFEDDPGSDSDSESDAETAEKSKARMAAEC
jgi:hypothetical protein